MIGWNPVNLLGLFRLYVNCGPSCEKSGLAGSGTTNVFQGGPAKIWRQRFATRVVPKTDREKLLQRPIFAFAVGSW